jgi:hypothetical protein
MTSKNTRGVRRSRMLLLAALAIAQQASAAEYWLQTGTTTVLGVPMWGYALCGTGSTEPASCAGAVTVPGPALTVPPGDPQLIVHLKNTLPEPTSLIITGQVKQEALAPVWFEPANPVPTVYKNGRPAGNKTARVRSFDKEADPINGSATYTWANIKPGTYLYSSGTHPQVQVQMGLYGALTKDAGTGNVAYSRDATNITYNHQVTLLYSEIDPALHAAVANGTYGPTGLVTSTLEYRPKYFLINGKPYPDSSLNPIVPPTLPAGQSAVPAGQNLLVRFINAGLKTHVPTINGQYWQVVAEDGNPLPYLGNPRRQYTVFLPAGKTMDVLLKPTNPSTTDTVRYAIYDSRYFDTDAGVQGGGMLAKLEVGPGVAAAPLFDSAPVTTATAGVTYTYAAHATDPDGQTVTYALVPGTPPVNPPAGMTIDATTGLINWPGVSVLAGTYPVTVRASDTTVPTPLFSDQRFNLVVTAAQANQAPIARNDTYTAVAHATANGAQQVVAAPGVLANDTDADGNPLTAVKVSECTLNANGTCTNNATPRVTLNANGDGGFTMTSSTSTSGLRVTYRARDNSGAANNTSNDATITINMVANRAPTAVADAFTVPRCTIRQGNACRTGAGFYVPLSLNLVSNDTDPDTQTIDVANQTPLAVARVRQQTSGTSGGSTSSTTTSSGATVTISAGSVTYTPPYNFSGTDTFQYRVKDKIGKESGSTSSNTNNLGEGWATVTVTVQ